MRSVMWFRRDLRLADSPALLEACADGAVLPLFVLDPALWGPAGPVRRSYLASSLRALDESLRMGGGGGSGGGLCVVSGDPADRVVAAALAVGAGRVHVAADFGPYGRVRDERVESALVSHGIDLVRTGSAYAVAPGRVVTGAGGGYQVFTPYFRAWAEHGWRAPVEAPADASWLSWVDGPTQIPDPPLPDGLTLPEAGETAALRRWQAFLEGPVRDYGTDRDRPGVEGTSRLSAHLKWGEIHPRTLLAGLSVLGAGEGAATYRKELAWREFYADVLARHPETARDYLRPDFARMEHHDPADGSGHFEAWCRGRTGYPVVDAGMRQLLATGWMHNRVRMIVASFLVKDLHVEWQHGARHFLRWLVDGDLASNQHGWQWVAGCGTDAAPYFRVFNPTAQGRRFDPDGAYVRRWVPELAGVSDPHDPDEATRREVGYPAPIVDHAEERREALARWERIRA